MRARHVALALTFAVVLFGTGVAVVYAATTGVDSLVFMPGTQPGGESVFERAGRCENCHSGYDATVEPGSNWRGSMMAQAARDPLWLACMTVANQDSMAVLGNFDAGDLCIRCHSPTGWIEGRSEPTNASALVGDDYDGVQCDFCHRMVDPFAEANKPATGDPAYGTYERDLQVLGALTVYGPIGPVPYLGIGSVPTYYGAFPAYSEAGSGQFFVDTGDNAKRGPFADTVARHSVYYSPFHSSQDFCQSCHDVSNPVLANLGSAGTTSRQAAASFVHVERTFSEFSLSAYGRGGAVADVPVTAWAEKCQDCHLPDVTGKGCNKRNAPTREDMPLHDMTGGNQWLTGILASVDPNGPVYDAYNYAILSGAKYSGASIDVGGLSGFGDEMARGQARALAQLEMAATLTEQNRTASELTIRVKNNTGHKLISGFPEGRRMFLSIDFYDSAGALLTQVNPYEPLVTEPDGAGNDTYVSGGTLTSTHDDLVWEDKTSSSVTGEEKTFHFVLADDRYKDNRIPPKGFDTANMYERIVQPRSGGADAPNYFTAAEYAGGYDDVTVVWPASAASYNATLNYQTTSKEYVEFLRDEINGYPDNPGDMTLDPIDYIVQDHPFFDTLNGWGNAMWDLWLHNGGSAPVVMATLGDATPPPPPSGCDITAPDAPTGISATSAKKKSVTISWDAVADVDGYRVYSYSGGKYTLLTDATKTSYNNRGLTSGQTYTYAVTAYRICPDDGTAYESNHSAQVSATAR